MCVGSVWRSHEGRERTPSPKNSSEAEVPFPHPGVWVHRVTRVEEIRCSVAAKSWELWGSVGNVKVGRVFFRLASAWL